MDNPGWHAQRRAAHERDHYLYAPPNRGPDGQYQPAEQVMPMQEQFIGGFGPPSPRPPSVPPKDPVRLDTKPSTIPLSTSWGPPVIDTTSGIVPSSTLTQMSAIERSKALKAARMHPHLQFMVGPLLRFDTVDDNGVWRGAALIVTADSGSIYDPYPTLTYRWDPDVPSRRHQSRQRSSSQNVTSFELGPHPADPHSTTAPLAAELQINGYNFAGPNARSQEVIGQELWVYGGNGGTFTFWRFTIRIPLGPQEMRIAYCINKGQEIEFFVPGSTENMRCAAHSCNGFSAGINPDDFRGPGFNSGYDPLWVDLLSKHAEAPFHVLVGGGDQLYCDSITREPELQQWVTKRFEQRREFALTEEIVFAIDRFYFNHYCKSFRSGAFARANSSIPMLNMCDDHDLIDGFDPDELQNSPVFNRIGSRGYFFFLLFQCFINPEVDGLDDKLDKHPFKSAIIGGPGAYIPFPSHSVLSYMGPQTSILLLDCRAERRKDQVCGRIQYEKVFARLRSLPRTVEHLIVQIGVPIAYPRMVFLETTLGSKFNPLVALGKTGSLGLSGMVNKFNGEAELLDDLNDHWTAKNHKAERNWFILELQKLALYQRIRVSFLSGDVHCGAVGVLKTLGKGKSQTAVPPEGDHRYMVNVVTSAIVNTPPPAGVITMVSSLATKVHKTLHYADTDEFMIPLFVQDPDGSPRKQKYIMGRRNWCTIDFDARKGELVFDLRAEKRKGGGETEGYTVAVPGPRWDVQQ